MASAYSSRSEQLALDNATNSNASQTAAPTTSAAIFTNVLHTENQVLYSINLIVAMVSFLVNFVLFVPFLMIKALRKISFVPIALLCASNLFASAAFIAISAWRIADIDVDISKLGCVAALMPIIVGPLLVQLSGLAIATERFIIVSFTTFYFNHKRAVIQTLVGLAVGLAVTIGLFSLVISSSVNVTTVCVLSLSTDKAWFVIWSAVQLVFTLVIIVLYAAAARKSTRVGTAILQQASTTQNERQRKLLKLMTALIVASLVTTIPASACRLIEVALPMNTVDMFWILVLRFGADLLTCVQGIVDFFIYFKKHEDVRNGVKKLLRMVFSACLKHGAVHTNMGHLT